MTTIIEYLRRVEHKNGPGIVQQVHGPWIREGRSMPSTLGGSK